MNYQTAWLWRQTFSHFAEKLNEIGLGYIHLVEPIGGRLGAIAPAEKLASSIQDIFEGTFILNQADVATFYMGEEKGYSDYPKMG